ncbi:MAG TPA: efflux RND transporter periplasmic adaptor subunit [Phycisphaerae bacterium]|nr:efflux RND transporter periplasmic adaptor subunit [Phycisphaerae bacterium]
MRPIRIMALAALLIASAAPAQERIEAITKPSGDVILAFVRPGRIAKVLVKEGDQVRAGQEMMRLDDEAEAAKLEQLKAEAEDQTRVLAAQAQLAQRKVDLKKMEQALEQGAATPMEVEHAKLDVTISELSLQLAEFQRKQAERAYKEAQIQLDRMRLLSPIDGRVERVLVEPGESADALEKIAQVVKIDPLWIDVPVPLEPARRLKAGGPAEVEFGPDESGKPKRVGAKIIHTAAVADAASGTLTVRVEAPNPTGRPAGEHVYVSFPPAEAAAAPRTGRDGTRASGGAGPGAASG